MFNFKVINELCCELSGDGKIFAKKGSMIAYQGNFRFEKSILGPNNGGGMMGAILGRVARGITGENVPIMVAEGSGKLYLAENAYHVELLELGPGDEASVESENLLAFTTEVNYGVKFLGSGVLSQKGLFTTSIKNNTNTTQNVALIMDGNPLMLEGPCCVDPDAVVAWTGRDPQVRIAQLSWKNIIGQASGESYHLEFTEPGQVVLVQPSERLSGLKLAID